MRNTVKGVSFLFQAVQKWMAILLPKRREHYIEKDIQTVANRYSDTSILLSDLTCFLILHIHTHHDC